MLRTQLKSKIHRAFVTDANVAYEGSITIPSDLMDAVDLWEGEKVLVASATTGQRLETYAQRGAPDGRVVMNGGAALRIGAGERITILAWGLSAEPVVPRKIVCDETNAVIRRSGGA